MQTGKKTAEKRWTKSTILAQIFCVIMLVIWLYPLIKIIQISFRSGGIENYKRVLFTVDSFSIANGYVKDIADFWVYLGNSMTVTAIDMALVLSITSLGAFAFSKMDFKGKEALYILCLVGMMMPAAGFIVPYFITSKKLGLLNTKFSLVGPHVADEMTLTLLPQKFTAFAGVSNVGTIFASLVLLCVPIFIIYLFAQKYMVAGMAAGTIK